MFYLGRRSLRYCNSSLGGVGLWVKISPCRIGRLRNWTTKPKLTPKTTTTIRRTDGFPAATAPVLKLATDTIRRSNTTAETTIKPTLKAASVGGLFHSSDAAGLEGNMLLFLCSVSSAS